MPLPGWLPHYPRAPLGRSRTCEPLISNQQAKFNIIDVKSRKVVFDRYVSFRGDSDKACRRAESFVASQILDQEGW